MDLEELTEKVSDRVAGVAAVGATFKFKIDDLGIIFVDATSDSAVVSNEDGDSDCTIILSLQKMLDIMDGKTSSMTAFMTGSLKIEGSMGVAMKLQSILG